MNPKTLRSDEHLMPWIIEAVPGVVKQKCVMICTMLGNEIQKISLHVATQNEESRPKAH